VSTPGHTVSRAMATIIPLDQKKWIYRVLTAVSQLSRLMKANPLSSSSFYLSIHSSIHPFIPASLPFSASEAHQNYLASGLG